MIWLTRLGAAAVFLALAFGATTLAQGGEARPTQSGLTVTATPVAHAGRSMTEEECQYSQEGGRTSVCHATGSPQHPYVLLRLGVRACYAHTAHPDDFIASSTSCD